MPPHSANRKGFSEKADDAVNGKRAIFQNGYLVSPAARAGRSKSTSRLLEAHPAEHAAHEAIALWHALEGVQRLAADQPEVADIARDVDRRKPRPAAL